ncbi:MAG: hypothetical protein QOG10_4291 [Kribbellaceae bacterium]|nr:hypothetical protein [Kribbellaceae bacterium]
MWGSVNDYPRIVTTIVQSRCAHNPSQLVARYRDLTENLESLTVFGKRILFTNRDDWTTSDVVAAYSPSPRSKPASGR